MSDQADNLHHLLKPFGLTDEEADIYLLVLKNQSLTALSISRELHLARTRVYRLLDKLIEKGMVVQKLSGRGLAFEAASISQLAYLIAQKEIEVTALRQTLPLVTAQLGKLATLGRGGSKVLYYTGVTGLKQVTWNSLKARKELLIYEIKNMNAFLDAEFCEKVRAEFVERRVHIREITNQRRVEDWTNVTELVKNYWQCRYVDPQRLKINIEVLIYNDVYATYSYQDKEIFCVEIYDRRQAELQKQLFNYIWQNARKMKILDERGVAVIEA